MQLISKVVVSAMYRVLFQSQDKVYEVYAKAIYQSEMYGFIEIEDYVFKDDQQLIVDPAEEKLKTEFAGVSRSYVPMHHIIRIDEVSETGQVRITAVEPITLASANVTPFPCPPNNPSSSDSE